VSLLQKIVGNHEPDNMLDNPDARGLLTKGEISLLSEVVSEGRALVIAANKVDAMSTRADVIQMIQEQISTTIPILNGVSIVPISAQNRDGLDMLNETIVKTFTSWDTRLKTSHLNTWLRKATSQQPPPRFAGVKTKRYKAGPLKIKYITQTSTRPPSFALFVNRRVPTADTIPETYFRYLMSSLKKEFGLPPPINIQIAKSKTKK